MKRAHLLLTCALASFATLALAAEHAVDQKDKQFSKKSLKIKVGDAVVFRNSDAVAHNVFSLSSAATFDLRRYPRGQSRTQTFAKAGIV